MTNIFGRFLRDESGANAVEYALICALICFVIMVGLNAIGSGVNSKLGTIATSVN